ncbi:MAG: tetratricopeptide (TPR) repeat protein/nucleoside-triphosphatase THEP1 [Polaribacter sp.]|jgi:tetratricopeptide (TPR) repeat protein/nucleoside-triphosphatase THEP1
MPSKTVACIYNPKNQSPEELAKHFIVRKRIFEKLFAEIKTSSMEYPEQHFMIEGKRGMGKTTLLLKLAYEVEQDEKLSKWLIPLNFNEEEYSVRKLYKFWERIIQLLAEKHTIFLEMKQQADHLSKAYRSDDEYERALYELLTKTLQSQKKKTILFIDNFGDMFQKFTDLEAHRLRKILQSSADIRLIAASSVVLEAFYQYNHPFYEFFKVERLEGLDAAQTKLLLLQLGEVYEQESIQSLVKNQPGRVEALRRLTGGVTRTIILLFEIFADDHTGNTFIDLEKVLDRVTPLYKHRMDDLTPGQQEVVETIALHWDAISVKEIQGATRMESKLISALLQQLTKQEIVSKIKTNTKNHLYQINERFFNIWYLMRHGRSGDKQKVLWLVRFLEQWCDKSEIDERSKRHIENLQQGNYNPKGAVLLSEALAMTNHLTSESQHRLLEATRDFLVQKNSPYVKQLIRSDVELLNQAEFAFKEQDFNMALPYLLKMKTKDDFKIAWVYHKNKNFAQAEKHYKKAATKGHVAALNNLAVMYERIHNKPKLAEKLYQKAALSNQPDALYNLGLFYKNRGKQYKQAEVYYKKSLDQKKDKDVLFSLANLYANELKQPANALKYYESAAKEGQMQAMNNLAYLYIEVYQDANKATKYFKQAIKSGLLYSENFIRICEEHPVNFHLLYLLAAKEYEFLYQHFNSPESDHLRIRDRLKPIYYATVFFLKKKYPTEWLRMGEELEETVMEIVEKVEKMRDS